MASERFPSGGMFIYAMIAAGGDLGASVAPQLIGIITDTVIEIPKAAAFAETHGFTPEQLGMKSGMLIGMLFPPLRNSDILFHKKTPSKYIIKSSFILG